MFCSVVVRIVNHGADNYAAVTNLMGTWLFVMLYLILCIHAKLSKGKGLFIFKSLIPLLLCREKGG